MQAAIVVRIIELIRLHSTVLVRDKDSGDSKTI